MRGFALWALIAVVAAGPAIAQTKPLVVASTPDVGAIACAVVGDLAEVQAIMPAGSDVHTFTVSSEQVRNLQRAVLVVFANSADLGFEKTIKAALGQTPSLDWPDYVAQGAALRDYPDYPKNPHGPWLRLDNARAMARAMAAKLEALGLPKAILAENCAQFERELAAQQATYARLAQEHGLAGKPLLAVIPGICDLIANAGVPVGAVLMAEGSGTVSGQQLADAVAKLKSGQYAGIVCPVSMKLAKQGEATRQVAADAGAPIAWVRFQDTDLAHDTYLSVSAFNAAALASLQATQPTGHAAPSGEEQWLLPLMLAGAAVLIGLVIGATLGKRLRPARGAGIFDEK